MSKVPHLVQYQGSKRLIAPEIIRYFPDKINRVIEPFSGTCAVTILAAFRGVGQSYIVNDINTPLIDMMSECVNNPYELAEQYRFIWSRQFDEGENSIDYFYRIRTEFNAGDKEPAKMLFLLSRVVKGAIRYNDRGEMNQSCDKRRKGTQPNTIEKNAVEISKLLKGKITFLSTDYKNVLRMAKTNDLIYMDPPYQGTSNIENSRDNRYIQGVDFDDFVDALRELNSRNIPYIVSYDGKTGDKIIGKELPEDLGLNHLLIDAGLSTQALLNGKKETTYESLYLSPGLIRRPDEFEQLRLALA